MACGSLSPTAGSAFFFEPPSNVDWIDSRSRPHQARLCYCKSVWQIHALFPDLDFNVITGVLSHFLLRPRGALLERMRIATPQHLGGLEGLFNKSYVVGVQVAARVCGYAVPIVCESGYR